MRQRKDSRCAHPFRDEGVFRFRHGFGKREKLSFRELERTRYAVREGLGDRLLLRGNRTEEDRN